MPVNPTPVYDDLNDEEIDAESPLTESVMTRLRDNSRATFRGDASVPAAELNLVEGGRTVETDTTLVMQPDGSNGLSWNTLNLSVVQGQLDTSSGSVSTASSAGTNLALPGGEYGFYPRTWETGSGNDFDARIAEAASGGSAVTNIWLTHAGGGGNTVFASQRYINACPPYDLGDGHIPFFLFADIVNGKIESMYAADVPPWVYNGPTNVSGVKTKIIGSNGKPEYKMMRKKFSKSIQIDDVLKGKATMQEYRDQKTSEELVELSTAYKNTDIDIIPHPFINSRGIVALIDPLNTEKILDMHREMLYSGEDVSNLFYDDYIRIGNDELNINTPKGVKAFKMSWKNTKGIK